MAEETKKSKVIVSSDATFAQDIASGVCIVDFWAEWCGPCQVMIPRLTDLADRMDGRARVMKVNVDENQNTAMTYRIMSIPTMIIFVDGKPAEQVVGVRSVDDLVVLLDKHIPAKA